MTIINQKSISGITSITFASAGDDLLTFHSNNGTERFRIDNSGNTKITAGIVTTLTVTGNGTVGGTLGVTGDVDVADKIVHTGDTNTAIRFPAADTITAETGGTERLRITSDGDVNIGPSANAHGHGLLTLSQSASAAFNALVIQQGNTAFTATDGLHVGIDANVDAYFKLFENRDFIFYTGTTNTEKLRIDSSGRIGIGITNPADLLHLKSPSGNANVRLTTGNTSSGFTAVIFGDTDDTNTGTVQYDHSNNSLQFEVNNSERMRIHAGGTLSVPTGIELGSGLDGTSANTLDDYEEGSFTPTYQTGLTSPSYTGTGGHYTKIGQLVTFTIRIRATGTNSSAHLQVGGLPFTSNAHNEGGVSFGYTDNVNGSNGLTGHIGENNTKISMYQFSGSNFNGNSGNGISGRTLHMRGFYYTNS